MASTSVRASVVTMDENLKNRIHEDMVASTKARTTVRTTTLRSLLAAITNAETSNKHRVQLDDGDVIGVIRSQTKQRLDSATTYEESGRPELADTERAEAAILEEYLPALLSEDELRELVATIIAEEGVTSRKGMGVVMKKLRSRDDVDPALAATITKGMLS